MLNVPVSCPDQLHSVPIAQMGNYQDFLKAAPQPLRDADPEQPKRLHTFGNPFKLDKKVSPTDLDPDPLQKEPKDKTCQLTISLSQGMMIDEADEFVTGPQNKGKRPGDSNNMTGGGPKRRRCMSPLLRLGRAYTPPVTPPASPRPPSGEISVKTVTHVQQGVWLTALMTVPKCFRPCSGVTVSGFSPKASSADSALLNRSGIGSASELNS